MKSLKMAWKCGLTMAYGRYNLTIVNGDYNGL